MSVLLTRPLEDSRRIADLLDSDGIACEIWPLTAIRPAMGEFRMPPTVDGIAVTSAHGIRALAALTPERGLPVLAVGERTAEVARGLGYTGVLSAGADAAALARLVSVSGLRHLLHPRGRDVAADLGAMLAGRGPRLSEAVLYAAEAAGPPPAPVAAALADGRIGLVTLWSRRNAEIFARWAGQGGRLADRVAMLAISARAAEPLAALGDRPLHVAERPEARAMLARIREMATP